VTFMRKTPLLKTSWLRTTWLAAGLTASVVLPGRAVAQPAPPETPATPNTLKALQLRGGYLGVGIQEITADRAKALRLPEEAGVEVTRVSADSPAEKAGIQAGDAILQYNGAKVDGLEQFTRLVRETPAGRDVKIEVFRNGSPQTLTVKIGSNSAARYLPEGWTLTVPDVPRIIQGMRSPILGIEAEALDGQFAQYFGVTEGVLVRSVAKDSSAEKAGMRAGDVILRVDDNKVATPGEITRRLRAFAGKNVTVSVMRDKKETAMTVNVESPGGSGQLGRARRMELLDPDQ